MAKELPPTLLTQSSLEDHPIFEWLEKNSRTIFMAVIGLALLLGIFYRYASNRHGAAEQDYFQAANAMELLKDPAKAQSAVKELQAILARRPELNAKYDGILAQNFLVTGNLNLATDYASQNFERIQYDASPLFLSYAKNSLSIGENKTYEALANALNLKEEMRKVGQEKGQHVFGAELYLFNLIRIAMLQHSLNEKDAESKSWEELLQISRIEHPLNFPPADVERAMSHFDYKGVTLAEFIQNNISLQAKNKI